ncbi:uncharacterized protein TNCV_4372741 [Trichonephila clavipes]|nr:uncharacterized protein TNCV_4372741 [Trichonephila clavipes]
MITNFFIPELNNHDVQELWSQQDSATCHTARATIDLLKDTFGDRLISRFGPVNWPPRSCDLTPLDYFLWGYVKSLVYADKPTQVLKNYPKCRNCGGGDRGRVAIYRPFGELRRAKIVLSPVWCSRPTTGVPLAHATMNFVGLDLTASDRWHQKTTNNNKFSTHITPI